MHRFIIDTDAGSDDAVAIMMALRHPDVRIEATTTVAGNVSVEQATRNALYICELCGVDVPVYEGIDQPLLREPSDAQHAHGMDGLGDLGLDPPRGKPQAEHATDTLVRCALTAPGEIKLVTLGPFSNIALALLREPDLAFALRHVYLMGGAVNALGNVTPSAEFNVWADPEAAKVVLHSGVGMTMVGWELVWGDMLLRAEEIDGLRASGSPCATFAVDCNRKAVDAMDVFLGERAMGLPDPIAMAMAIDESICRTEFLYVKVETTSELTRGETVVDRWDMLGHPPNVHVCFHPDAARFRRMLFDCLEIP